MTGPIISLLLLCMLLCPGSTANGKSLVSSADEEEQEALLAPYIQKYCQGRGRSFVRVQHGIVVDCMTHSTLWKFDFADNWSSALTTAMTYPIYDDYRGEPENAPRAGVVLVQANVLDYKYVTRLKQLVKYYHLPVEVETIDDYGGYAHQPEDSYNEYSPGFLDELGQNLRIKLQKFRITR